MKARAVSVNHLSRSAWHRAWTTVSLGVLGEWITIGKPCSLLEVPGNGPASLESLMGAARLFIHLCFVCV